MPPALYRLTSNALVVTVLMLPAAVALAEVENDNEFNSSTSSLRGLRDRAAEVTIQALSLLGIRYTYGGNTRETGLDCSGLVRHVFKEAWGAKLPRTSKELSGSGQEVDVSDMQPGDLVFFNTLKRTFSHVGIYLGDKKFIHAPSSNGHVRVESMDVSYWKARFDGARRIKDPSQVALAE